MEPSFDECIQVARQALKPGDIPAVVFYDTHADVLLAESCTRFSARDNEPSRYIICMRIPLSFTRYFRRRRQPRGNIVDIHDHAVFTSRSELAASD